MSVFNSPASSPRGKPEIVGSNLDTLVNTGLDEKLPVDYRLAQQVCHAIANISDRRKVCGVVTSKLERVGVLLSTLNTHLCYLTCPQQPSMGERHPPFRLPQEHRLFERLREMVTKGELPHKAWGRSGSSVCGGSFPLFLCRQHPPRPTLGPVQGGSRGPHLPAG